jgi:hypothetical protein
VHIDWVALLIVAGVSIVAAVVFMTLLAAGIQSVVKARAQAETGGSSGPSLPLGYTLLTLAGLLVLFGLYLIVPQFH